MTSPAATAPVGGRAEGPLSRLWWSYQRYALGLGAMAALLVGAALVAAACWSAWWVLAALPAWKMVRFAAEIWSHYPRKLALTRQAAQAIAEGTFSVDALRGYCGDPCYRVVADEILRYTGRHAAERRQVIWVLRREQQAARAEVFVVQHGERGVPEVPAIPEGQRLPARVSVRFGAPSQPEESDHGRV